MKNFNKIIFNSPFFVYRCGTTASSRITNGRVKKECCFRGYHMFIWLFGMQKLESKCMLSKCMSCSSPIMNAIDNAVFVVKDGVVVRLLSKAVSRICLLLLFLN